MNIEEQKQIADELLECLEVIAPHAILAGGAPRDWYMGNTANDLDFYISLQEGLQSGWLRDMVIKALPDGVSQSREEYKVHQDPMYKHMEGLANIYYFEYKGLPFQVIRLRETKQVFKAVDNMSCSICKAWYKNHKINLTKDFKITLKTKLIYLNEDYRWTDYHPAKMVERFIKEGGFRKGTLKSAKDMLVYMALKEFEKFEEN